jgi:hypothetical protein
VLRYNLFCTGSVFKLLPGLVLQIHIIDGTGPQRIVGTRGSINRYVPSGGCREDWSFSYASVVALS